MKYRVLYPMITQDWQRDFETKEEAEQFARQRRLVTADSHYYTKHSWRLVEVIELAE